MPQPAAAFLSRDFFRYQCARVGVIVGAEAQALAVAWQIYQITHKAIDLGYTGLILFLPGLLFILPAGHAADRFDRRHVILICYSLQAFCSLALFAFAWTGIHQVWPIFVTLFVVGTGRAFSGPASSALIPHLVPAEHFVNAITWGATIFQFANIVGPALGGVLFTLPLALSSPSCGFSTWSGRCTCGRAAWSIAPSRAKCCWPDSATSRVRSSCSAPFRSTSLRFCSAEPSP